MEELSPREAEVLELSSSAGPGNTPFRTAFDGLIYIHCARVLGDVPDPYTRTTQAQGAAFSLKEALDAELNRTGTTAKADSAD